MKESNQGFDHGTLFVFFIFITSTIITTTTLPRIWYAVTLFLMLVFAVIAVYRQTSVLQAPLSIFAPFFTIYLLYLLGVLIEPFNVTQAMRSLILIFTSICCVFIVPTAVRRDHFLKIITVIAVSVLLIGIPANFIGDYSVGPIDSMVYSSHDILGYEIYQITSLMSNPNPIGKVSFFGLLSSFVWFDKKKLWLGVVSVCALGLVFSGSRAAFLATFGALFIYLLGYSGLSNRLNEIVLFFTGLSVTGFLMLMRILPAPEFILTIDLSYRLNIWNAGLDAGLAKPIFGHGPENVADIVRPYSNGYVGAGVYNSFIRLFATTGIFGAISYIYIYYYAIIRYTPNTDYRIPMIIYSMFIGYAIDELFSGNSIFGISIMSVVASCLVGYILYDSMNYYS